MIYNYTLRYAMIDGNGTVSDGTESAAVSFNYPTSASSLTDVPAFTQRTESAVSSPTSTFSYSSADDGVAQTKTFSITRPDSTVVELARSTNGTSAGNGRLTKSALKDGSTVLAKTELTYATDSGGAAQVQSVVSYDDAGTPVKVDFDYDQYGNVTNKREYGHQISGQWLVRRRTHLTYKTDTAYISAHMVGLVTQAEVMSAGENTNDNDDVVIAKSSQAYDNYSAMGGMEEYTGQTSPPGHSGIGASTTVRGNVTGTTQWTDITANTSITRLAKYDKFGNVVKAEVSCCQEKTLTLDEDTYWSQSEEQTRGGSSETLTETSEFDFNTSVIENQTDPGGQTAEYGYDAALRINQVTAPVGAIAAMSYDSLSTTQTLTYDDGGMEKTLTSSTVYDGWGRVIQEWSTNGSQVNTNYDSMGRVTSRTNPFAQGGTPSSTRPHTSTIRWEGSRRRPCPTTTWSRTATAERLLQ